MGAKKRIVKDRYDILLLGSLVNNDLVLAEHLSRRGLRCCVVRKKDLEHGTDEKIDIQSNFHTGFSLDEIHVISKPLEFLKVAWRSKLIISFTGSLIQHLRGLWFLRAFLFLPPVINITTGSDITELAGDGGFRGYLYRQYLRFVKLNICLAYPYALKNIIAYRFPNIVFLPFVYFLPEISRGENSKVKKNESGRIIFFHASNLDWKVLDSGENRNSSKGNDRFLKAFSRAIHDGINAHCIILERGPDVKAAKKLIHDLNLEEFVEWKPHLTRDQLIDQYLSADVVVDQFDIGGYGGITIEAMALQKPVLTYVNENAFSVFSQEYPPILNASTEQEIYNQIMRCRDMDFLLKIGRDAQDWVYKHYDSNAYLNPLLFYYSLFTGHQVVDYGWEIGKRVDP